MVKATTNQKKPPVSKKTSIGNGAAPKNKSKSRSFKSYRGQGRP